MAFPELNVVFELNIQKSNGGHKNDVTPLCTTPILVILDNLAAITIVEHIYTK